MKHIDVFCVFPDAVDATVRVGVVGRALEEIYGVPAREVSRGRRVVLTEPAGRRLTQGYVDDVAAGPDLTVICGRYGGMDERVWNELATEADSLGDFVLSGGEIVAAALADAAIRRLHGVLGNAESLEGESFAAEGVIGPPQYTRPANWAGTSVPYVLLSGNHARIHAWRKEEARLRATRKMF